jgi:hypothetical protein
VRQFLSDKRVVAFAAFIAIASSACVHKGDPSVGINKIEANLVFGVKPPADVASVPSDIIPDLVPEIADLALHFAPLPGIDLNKTAPKECPDASNTAVVEVPTEVTITGIPLQGIFRWKHSGSLTLSDTVVPFTGFEKRVVRNYKKIDAANFEFQTIQPSFQEAGKLIESTFHVKTDGVNQTIDAPAGPVQGPTVRQPDGGVVLTKLQTLDSSGNPVGTAFAPVTGLLMLPIPVTADETWQSVAVDPKSGQTIVQNATVSRRARIDACGDLVDGWAVTARQVVASIRNVATTMEPPQFGYFGYDYIVATQFGGMLIDERLTQPDPLYETLPATVSQELPVPPTPSPIDLDFTLGQLKPDPLPAN